MERRRVGSYFIGCFSRTQLVLCSIQVLLPRKSTTAGGGPLCDPLLVTRSTTSHRHCGKQVLTGAGSRLWLTGSADTAWGPRFLFQNVLSSRSILTWSVGTRIWWGSVASPLSGHGGPVGIGDPVSLPVVVLGE